MGGDAGWRTRAAAAGLTAGPGVTLSNALALSDRARAAPRSRRLRPLRHEAGSDQAEGIGARQRRGERELDRPFQLLDALIVRT